MTKIKTSSAVKILAAVGVVSMLLTGCGSSAKKEATALDTKKPVTLTWWTGQETRAEKVLEGLALEFQKLHPNVTVKVSPGAPTTDDLLQKISAGFVGGNYPDISYAYGSWTGELASSGRMLDITEKVSDSSVNWEEFPESGRLTVAPDGKVIGFPAVVDNLALLYNKTLFDKAGLEYPTNNWSWDQFRKAAKALTNPATQTFGTAYPVDGSEDTTWRFWPLLWQHGGEILNSDKTAVAFDSKAGIDALNVLRTMAVEDKSVFLDQTDAKFEPLFVSGRIGMIPDGPWLLSDLKDGKTNYGVAFLPGTNGNHSTVSGPDVWALFDHKDANRAYWSYELIKWITSTEQDVRYSLALGNLPMRAAPEMKLPEYKKTVNSFPGFEVMTENFSNVRNARPTIQGYPGISAAIGKAIAEVLQGKKTSEVALKEAAAESNKILAGK